MNKIMELWIARNDDNSLWLHQGKPSPVYIDYERRWVYESELWMEIDDDLYPEVTFENSPQKVKLEILK